MLTELLIEGAEIRRSELYSLVWRYETKAIAARCDISGSLLGRVCRRWNIPKPGRGYWQQTQAGQIIKTPPLPKWSGPDADPVALRKSGSGYGTTVPPVARAPRPRKPDALTEWFAAHAAEQQLQRCQRQAEILRVMDGDASRFVLTIREWEAEHHLEVGVAGIAVHLEDSSNLKLLCTFVLPISRSGQDATVDIRFDLAAQAADEAEPLCGTFHSGKRHFDLPISQTRAAYICSTLAAGKLRVIDLEAVVGRGREHAVRWAKLCTKTHDDVEAGKYLEA